MSGLTGPEVTKSGGVAPVSGAKAVTEKVDATDSRAQSSISASEEVVALMAIIAAFPTLPTPSVTLNNLNEMEVSKVTKGTGSPHISQVSAPAVLEMIIQKKNDIIMDMLDAWIKNIRIQADRIAEELRSPHHQVWLERQSPQFRAKTELLNPREREKAIIESPEYLAYVASLQQSQVLLSGLANAIGNYLERAHQGVKTAIQALPSFAAIFVSGISAPIPGMVVSGTSQAREVVSPGVFEQIWQNTSVRIPNDFRVELGWIAALLGAGLAYQTMTDNIPNFKPGARSKQVDITEARIFARNVIKMVEDPEINLFIQTMLINKMDKSELLPENRRKQLSTMVKCVLLTMALALVYRVEYGGISKGELEDMRSGKLPTEDILGSLAGLLRDYLSTLDSIDQKLLKNALFDYLASRPPLDHLMQPNRVFRGVLQNLNNMAAAAA